MRNATRRSRWIIAMALGIVLLGACSSGGESRADESNGKAPDGAALYRKSCGGCHGANLRGTDKGPSQLSQVYEPNHHPDDAYRSAIANGVTAHHWNFGAMPPVKGLSPQDVDAIIAFIRQQQHEHGFEPYPPR